MRRLIALFIVLICAALVFLVVRNYTRTAAKEMFVEDLLPSVDLALQKISYTETKDGENQWTLNAKNVLYENESGEATLEQIDLQLFLSEARGGDVLVTSQGGAINRAQKRVELAGDVLIEQPLSSYKIRTQKLTYDAPRKEFSSLLPVQFHAEGFEVSGVGMTFDYQRRHLVLKRDVEAVFHER